MMKNFQFSKKIDWFYTPSRETEYEIWYDISKLYKYAEEVGETDEISVYPAMRLLGYHTPSGLKEYGYNLILSSAEMYKTNHGEYVCRFRTVKRRAISDDFHIRYSWDSDAYPVIYR